MRHEKCSVSAISKTVSIAVSVIVAIAAIAGASPFLLGPGAAPAEREPIKIGFGMALTGAWRATVRPL